MPIIRGTKKNEKIQRNNMAATTIVDAAAPVQLRKQLGLLNGIGIIIGIVVGSGIFVSPKGVIMEAGSVGACIVVWGLCGVICMAGALCYAELGTCMLTSGADYTYLRESLGDLSAFLYLWVVIVVLSPAANAIISLTFANYVLQPFFPECGVPQNAVRLLAAACICFLTFINCRNVKWATRVQDVFTCTKVLALIIVVVVGLVKIAMGNTENFSGSFEGTTEDPGHMSLAFYSGLFSYSGWNSLNLVTEEIKDPHKNLPRAICISLPFVTVIYIMVNVAYFTVMTPGEIIASEAVAVTFADRTLGVMSWIMPVFVAFSTFGSLNGIIFTNSRMYFVGARHGHLPGILATINLKNMTPVPSLLFGSFTSLLWLCVSDVYTLINYAIFAETIFMSLVALGLIVLRYTKPNLKRPIKVSLIFPVFYLVVCTFLVVTPLTSSPMECLMGLIMIVSGIPVFMLGVKWEKKPDGFNNAFKTVSDKVQILLSSAHEDSSLD